MTEVLWNLSGGTRYASHNLQPLKVQSQLRQGVRSLPQLCGIGGTRYASQPQCSATVTAHPNCGGGSPQLRWEPPAAAATSATITSHSGCQLGWLTNHHNPPLVVRTNTCNQTTPSLRAPTQFRSCDTHSFSLFGRPSGIQDSAIGRTCSPLLLPAVSIVSHPNYGEDFFERRVFSPPQLW